MWQIISCYWKDAANIETKYIGKYIGKSTFCNWRMSKLRSYFSYFILITFLFSVNQKPRYKALFLDFCRLDIYSDNEISVVFFSFFFFKVLACRWQCSFQTLLCILPPSPGKIRKSYLVNINLNISLSGNFLRRLRAESVV